MSEPSIRGRHAEEENPLLLVADDDPSTLAATARLLRIGGYEVIEAQSGAEAEARTLAARPDLVLLDVDLGDDDGREVCARLKRDPSLIDTFFVLASGVHTSSDEQATGLELGADGYIARPIGNRELLARVESYLRIRAAERDRRKYEAFLQRAHRWESLGALAAGIGREVTQPLTEALDQAEQLRTHLGTDASLTSMADVIINRCRQSLDVIRTLARLSDRTGNVAEVVDPAEVIDEVLSLLRHQLTQDDRIVLTSDLPPDLPPVRGDRSELAQAFASLILNGRDALCERFPGAHPEKQLRITARRMPESGRVRISIADSGPGMPAEVSEHIFDPFAASPGLPRGAGLSLSLVRQMIMEQHGEVSLESQLGRGSTYHVELPSADA